MEGRRQVRRLALCRHRRGSAVVPAVIDAVAPVSAPISNLADRQRVTIFSTSWQTVTLMAPQDRDYTAFITQLHARMQRAGSKAALVGGLKSGLYIAGAVVVALVAISITGLLVRALATGEFAGALFLVGFAALFGWQIGGFMRRNRPQTLYVRSSAAGAAAVISLRNQAQ